MNAGAGNTCDGKLNAAPDMCGMCATFDLQIAHASSMPSPRPPLRGSAKPAEPRQHWKLLHASAVFLASTVPAATQIAGIENANASEISECRMN
jgi:hypothetical protein